MFFPLTKARVLDLPHLDKQLQFIAIQCHLRIQERIKVPLDPLLSNIKNKVLIYKFDHCEKEMYKACRRTIEVFFRPVNEKLHLSA